MDPSLALRVLPPSQRPLPSPVVGVFYIWPHCKEHTHCMERRIWEGPGKTENEVKRQFTAGNTEPHHALSPTRFLTRTTQE